MGPEGPGSLFGDSFGSPAPEGPGDSCSGTHLAWKKNCLRAIFVPFSWLGRFAKRFARIDSRESFAIETPIFIARVRPIRTNHSNFRFG